MNNTLKKSLFIFMLLLFVSGNLFAQKNYIKKRWNIKLGYARYATGIYSGNKAETTGNVLLEANYGLSRFFEAGIYTAFSSFYLIGSGAAQNEFVGDDFLTPFYGLNINFHILPFFINENDFRFDLYITGKYGGQYFPTPDNYFMHGNIQEYGIGGGLSFYLWKHLGCYAEYTYGKYYFENNSKFRFGLTYKF